MQGSYEFCNIPSVSFVRMYQSSNTKFEWSRSAKKLTLSIRVCLLWSTYLEYLHCAEQEYFISELMNKIIIVCNYTQAVIPSSCFRVLIRKKVLNYNKSTHEVNLSRPNPWPYPRTLGLQAGSLHLFTLLSWPQLETKL